jgi:hypothetical protein
MRFFILAAALVSLVPTQAYKAFPLDGAIGLRLNNVTAEPATLEGKRGVRVAMAAAALKRLQAMTPEQQAAAAKAGDAVEQLALVDGLTFANGTIDVELAGTADASVFKDARGFVGIAFRVQEDLRTYDAFYIRPTNGRAEDQIRRNHAAQYISHPAWPWFRLRTETPEKYESYVDLVPGAWTQFKIEVKGAQGRLYVHGQPQPTLIVNDLKTGPTASGAVALWLDIGTTAYFRNLKVTP